ncbi:helix-turn-helix domain-containing protein [Opitutaceae bacterium TAV4]|uniref:helix-turn-helix domain-containing protein n=1 Tax=Geminisphaera colitermitum TaxID=1148786 RepID=UPI000158CA1E|nr:helix-turn-helix domain-containing protein [Geminisphaera colitermitum]RRJ94472.1 helix-turn-helix domain-containing protein [Opitutaceae bacterium TAV4]RRJ98529.1 helix-turn-helix domain-containing protein [Opitutaceae bacterium TAV3]
MAVLAKGVDYFGADGFPVTVRRVATQADGGESHPHDVTEIEHWHDFCELAMVTGGRGVHVLEGESFHVSTGDVFVLQGRQVHCFRERQGLALINVMYDPERLPLPLGLLRRLPGYSALFMLEPTFRSTHRFSSRLRLARRELGSAEAIVERIENESKAAQEGHEAVLLSLLVELMVLLSRHYAQSDTRESHALLQVGQLVSMLEQRFGEPWTLEQLAEQARVSRSNLLRMFRQATGQSPIDFLIGLRIEAARRLLRRSDLGMTEIALECGFSDGNYFARQFRKTCGVTPSIYRRQMR